MKKNKFSTIALLLLPLLLFALFSFRIVSKGRAQDWGIDKAAVTAHLKELTSDSFGGRQIGSPGGQKASEYIKDVLSGQGIKGAGKDGYSSFFGAVTALVESSEFIICDAECDCSDALEIFSDYNPETAGLGGSIDYTGDILLADGPIENIPGEMLLGRVVAAGTSSLTYEAKKHVVESGGEGLLYCDSEKTGAMGMDIKSVDASGKEAESIFMARISGDVYGKLKDIGENGIASGVEIRVKIGFPYVEGENIIGLIPAEASDECLIFAAGYDGYGEYGEEEYVPGAIDNAGGVAGLLELSRNISEMDASPAKNIVLLFFDGDKTGARGLVEYFEDPLFPPGKTELVLLENIGWKDSDRTWIASANSDSLHDGLASRLVQSYGKEGIDISIEDDKLPAGLVSLKEKGLSALRVASSTGDEFAGLAGTPKDNMDQLDYGKLEKNLSGCLKFCRASCYDSPYSWARDMGVAAFVVMILALLYVSYAVHTLHRRHPCASIGGKTIASLCFSTPFMLIDGLLGLIAIALFVVALAALAANIHLLDSMSLGGAMQSIYSFVMSLGIDDFKNMFDEGLALSSGLVAASLALAFVGGLFAGIGKGSRKRGQSEGRGMLHLAALSLPQVFIALALLYVSTKFMGMDQAAGGTFSPGLEALAVSVLSMTLVPLAWLSGKAEAFTEKEMARDYVAAAKARGFSTKDIASRHVFKGVLIDSVELIPGLAAIALSNLIVVEYIFGLPGVMNRMLVEIKNPKTVFFALVFAGALYIVFVLFSKALAALLKHRGRC